MFTNEPFSSLENCDISNGRIHHTEDCTCTIADIEAWYNEYLEAEAERQTENFSNEL